ncbi:MAG TPA: tol-pal system protein YbgF [bacterium]|nr:tol-pal system protein YbgF [bacterium]
MRLAVHGLAWLILLSAGGCATRKEIVKFQQDIALIEDQLTGLQSRNDRLGRELEEIRKELAASREEQRRTRADILSEISVFKEQAYFLRSQIDDTGSRMSRLLQNMEGRHVPVVPEDSARRPAAADDITPKALYDAAYLDLVRKNYDLALEGFREYLRRYPVSEYADNAQYWIGEIFYARRDYTRALEEFSKVPAHYPEGRKVPSALLKAGYSLSELNRHSEAVSVFREIIRRFPQSEEAGLARARL